MDAEIHVTFTVKNCKNPQSALAKVISALYSGRSHYDDAYVHMDAITDKGQYIITAYEKQLSPEAAEKYKASPITLEGVDTD